MESLVIWYQNSLGSFMPKEVFIFLVSMLPLIEAQLLCRTCYPALSGLGIRHIYWCYSWKYSSDTVYSVVY